MAKYHISPTTGNPNKCYAEKRPCPHGGAADHYPSKEEARAAYEAKMEAGAPAPVKKAPAADRLQKLLDAHEEACRDFDNPKRGENMQRLRAQLDKELPPPPAPAEMMAKIATPAGFTRTEGTWEGYVWGNQPPKNLPQLTLEGDGIKIQINFSDEQDGYTLADGHVSFTTDKGTRTFDRHGVEDSFYIDNPRKQWRHEDPTEAVNETIRDFIERKVPESRARIAGQETVPGLAGRLISPEQKAKIKRGETVQLVPAGFGTGYALSTRKTAYATPATAEQKRFFGVQELWISSFDCD